MGKRNSLLFTCAMVIILIGCQTGDEIKRRELDVQAEDVILHARVAGDDDSGCVMIAINGGPGLTSSYMWDLEQLAGGGCAVVTYDQRGLGKSSQPDDPDSPEGYTLQKYAQDLEAVRQETGADRVHLFGHSFGGIIAMQYIESYPEHVASLTFYGSGPPTWEGIELSQQNFNDRLISMIQDGTLLPPEEWEEGSVDPLLPVYFADPAFTFPENAQGEAPQFDQKVSDLTYQNLVGMDYRQALGEVELPVLLMFGKQDPFGLQMAEAVRDALSNAPVEYVVIDYCGHFWHECEDEFYPRIDQFLEEQHG